MDWQPIETAPKDGTTLDLWAPGRGRVTDCIWLETDRGSGFFDWGPGRFYEVKNASHWIHVQPPASLGQGFDDEVPVT